MKWVKINERILELEAKEELTEEEVKEWIKLVKNKIPGILVRNEKDIRKTKAKERRKEEGDTSHVLDVHGSVDEKETLF